MKKFIIYVLLAVLAIFGIVGGIFIREYVLEKKAQPESFYTEKEAASLFTYIVPSEEQKNEIICLYDELKPEEPFTIEDFKRIEDIVGKSVDQNTFDPDELKEGAVLTREEVQAIFAYYVEQMDTHMVERQDLLVFSMNANSDKKEEQAAKTDSEEQEGTQKQHTSNYIYETQNGEYALDMDSIGDVSVETYTQKVIDVYVAGNTIIKIIGESNQEITLSNAWIMDQEKNSIHFFYNGLERELHCRLNGADDSTDQESKEDKVDQKIADLVVNTNGVKAITLKPDVITDRVIAVKKDSIQLEKYGSLPVSEQYLIYDVSGKPEEKESLNILVGYEKASFVVADGVIEAALIKDNTLSSKIRVLINNNGYTSLRHENAIFSVDCGYTVVYGEEEEHYYRGKEIEVTPESDYFKDKNVTSIKIIPDEENGRIRVLSVKRGSGIPEYRGTLEISLSKDKLILINELPMEEYLYAVVPSEMPSDFEEEALKAQAICARSYAYQAMTSGTFAKYGAHLDDSTKSQVYNNVGETEEAIAAVDATKGLVPEYEGKVITAYFFSTSAGTTSSNADVWGGSSLPYLRNQLETKKTKEIDLSEESDFTAFISENKYKTLEKEYPFYRWKVKYTNKQLTSAINSMVKKLSGKDDGSLTVKNGDGDFVADSSIESIGDVESVTVIKRGCSGILETIQINGTKEVIQVNGQTAIRSVFCPSKVKIVKQDDTEIENWETLPSAYFYVKEKKGAFVICGGGFGHGVGMSQNGADVLAKKGYDASQIIGHYYAGVTLENIYENQKDKTKE